MADISIAVIGAGASAVALLNALSCLPDIVNVDLCICDPSPHLWRGRAYQPDDDCVLVNSVPADMTVVPGDPNHLSNWLAARRIMLGNSSFVDELSGSVFIPRAVYGDYLEQSARQALLVLGRRGWQVTFVREQVTGIRHVGQQVEISSATGCRLADYAVLATGAGAPTDIFGLAGAENFVADPYPLTSTMFDLPGELSVAVIGTGLTAVDIAMGLRVKGHRGPIRLLSRSGTLPGVRQRAVELQMRYFTAESIELLRRPTGMLELTDVIDLMRQELDYRAEPGGDLLVEISGVHTESGIERLRRQLGEVDGTSIALRLLQQAVPEVGPDIWPHLKESVQEELLRSHYRTIMSLCCPMPPMNARALLELADSGQLTVEANLQDVRRGAGHAHFDITVDGREEHADVVVSAVNARIRGCAPAAADLMDGLVAQDLAIAHPRGGLVTQRQDSRVLRPDRRSSRIYTLGDPASGSFFFTFGVQSLLDRAVDIAQDLLIRSRTVPAERPGPLWPSSAYPQGAPA